MPQPTMQNVHVNRPLTNLSIAYMQDQRNFIASQVFPNVPVENQSDLYYTIDRGAFNRDEMAVRAAGAESVGSGYKLDANSSYAALVWAFHHDIPDQVVKNADQGLNLQEQAMQFVSRKALLKRETQFVSKYFVPGIWTNDRAGVAAAPGANQTLQWSDPSSTPIEDVRHAKSDVLESTGFLPNKLTIGRRVFDVLLDHPDIIARISGGATTAEPAIADLNKLAQLFGVDQVLVMNAIKNTSLEGAAASAHSFIGGKRALLTYSPAAAGLMTPSAGYTFSWTGMDGSGAEGNRIKTFRMEHLSSDRVEIEMAFDMKLVAADLGAFWDTIVA